LNQFEDEIRGRERHQKNSRTMILALRNLEEILKGWNKFVESYNLFEDDNHGLRDIRKIWER
jgi:hypothetical protein